jgi:hypothetical protein
MFKDKQKRADHAWCKMNAYNALTELFDAISDNWFELLESEDNQLKIFEPELPEGVTISTNLKSA